MRVLAIGRTEWLYNTILRLKEINQDIVMIITATASPESSKKEDDYKALADKLGVPFIKGVQLDAYMQEIRDLHADIAVSMNWPAIIGEEFIGIFPHGVLNAHPGDLPRYRGNACPNWAMLNHEDQVALTIHEMIPNQLDAGRILLKRYITNIQEKTIGEIYKELLALVPEAYAEAIMNIERDCSHPIPQEEVGLVPLRCYPRKPVDSLIHWNDSAENIVRLIKASGEPFAGAYSYFNHKRFVVWDAYWTPNENEVLAIPGQVAWKNADTGEVGIIAGNGFVVLRKIAYDGLIQRPAEVLTSLRCRLGMCMEEEIEELWKAIRKSQQTE